MKIENGEIVEMNEFEMKAKQLMTDYISDIFPDDASIDIQMDLSDFYDLYKHRKEKNDFGNLAYDEVEYIKLIAKELEKEEKEK